MRQAFLYIIMCMSLLAMAQDTIPIPVAAGINLGANRLDFPGSRQQFDSLLIRMHDSQQKLSMKRNDS